MERSVLPREELLAETPYGAARAKRVALPGGGTRVMPEHDDVVALVEASSKGAGMEGVDSPARPPLSYEEACRSVQRAVEDGRFEVVG